MKQNNGTLSVHPFFSVIISLFAGVFFLPATPMAGVVSGDEWDISADRMTRYENPASIVAEGNVLLKKISKSEQQVKSGDKWSSLLEEEAPPGEEPETRIVSRTMSTIQADWIAYDIDRGTIKARGNILIRIGNDQLSAAQGDVDLKSETGSFTDAAIIRHADEVHLEGRVIEKTGDITYHIEDGWIITCKLQEGQTPPWSFTARSSNITEGGYAVLKHTTFRIKNVPVLYSPWMIVPVKNTRQTGFLFPEISTSDRDGFGFDLPLFVNLSPSSDLTLFPGYLSKRGLHSGLEFRYVADERTKGTFMANYLHDDLSIPSETAYYKKGHYSHTNQDRYWLRAKADQEFGGWVSRLDLDIVSDRDYLSEFNSGLTGLKASHEQFADVFGRGLETSSIDERRNTLSLLKSWDGMSVNAELLGINDVRRAKDNPTPLWKLPSLKYTGLTPLGDTVVDFDWQAGYVNFWREDGIGAQRFDFSPRLSAPIPLGDYLEAAAGAGVRDTLYFVSAYGDSEWQGDDSENRFLYEFDAEVSTTVVGDFDFNGESVNAWRHTMRPYLSYKFTEDEDQSALPLFDDDDRVQDNNLLTYGLDNFFKIFGDGDSKEYERDYGSIKISQGYDFRDEQSDTPFTPVNMKLAYYPLRNFSLIYKTDVDVYGDGAVAHGFEGRYANSRGDSVLADYRYNEPENIDSVSLDAKVNLINNFKIGYLVERSLEDSKTIKENISLLYSPACWSVELMSNRTQSEQEFMVVFRLANIGNPFGLDL